MYSQGSFGNELEQQMDQEDQYIINNEGISEPSPHSKYAEILDQFAIKNQPQLDTIIAC